MIKQIPQLGMFVDRQLLEAGFQNFSWQLACSHLRDQGSLIMSPAGL